MSIGISIEKVQGFNFLNAIFCALLNKGIRKMITQSDVRFIILFKLKILYINMGCVSPIEISSLVRYQPLENCF
jgi:hypothetical protein